MQASKCDGEYPVSAKVDRSMRDLVDAEATRLGVSRSEVIRMVFDVYAASRRGDLACPSCSQEIELV